MIMGYFESTDSTEAGAYSAAADSLSESLTFGITTDKDIITGMEADVNTVVVYKKVGWLSVGIFVLFPCFKLFSYLDLKNKQCLFVCDYVVYLVWEYNRVCWSS